MTTEVNSFVTEDCDGLKAVSGGFEEKADKRKSRPREKGQKGIWTAS